MNGFLTVRKSIFFYPQGNVRCTIVSFFLIEIDVHNTEPIRHVLALYLSIQRTSGVSKQDCLQAAALSYTNSTMLSLNCTLCLLTFNDVKYLRACITLNEMTKL